MQNLKQELQNNDKISSSIEMLQLTFEYNLDQCHCVLVIDLLLVLMLGIEIIENSPGCSYEKFLNPR